MVDLNAQGLAEWCDTLGPVLPPKTRAALQQCILTHRVNGHDFSLLVNQHELVNLSVPEMTLALANKVRKCWHRDYPKSTLIRPAVPGQRRPSPTDTCEDELWSQRQRQCHGSLPGSGCANGSQRHSLGASPGSARTANSIGAPQPRCDSASAPSAPGVGRRAGSQQVELLRAALDCVAERASLDRHEMYLWVHSVIPNEIWQPLWDGVTADLLRQQHEQPQEVRLTAKRCIQERRLAQAPAPFHIAGQQRGQQQRLGGWSPERFDQDSTRSGPSEGSFVRSEAETSGTQAMPAWLEIASAVPCLRPLELAEWLRTLPSGEMTDEDRKPVARRVLDDEIDGRRFAELLQEGRWDELGIADARGGNALLRLFRMQQQGATLQEASKVRCWQPENLNDLHI